MDELVLALLLYLKSYGIEPIDSVSKPIVTFHSDAELTEKFKIPVFGACIDSHIFINQDKVNLKTIEGKSVLLHELVHFTQDKCPLVIDFLAREYRERIAYQLQNQYLMDNNVRWRSVNPNQPDVTEGYTRPRPILKGYGGQAVPQAETSEQICKRMNSVEMNPTPCK